MNKDFPMLGLKNRINEIISVVEVSHDVCSRHVQDRDDLVHKFGVKDLRVRTVETTENMSYTILA